MKRPLWSTQYPDGTRWIITRPTHTHTHTRHIRFWRREANGKMTTEWKCCVCPPRCYTRSCLTAFCTFLLSAPCCDPAFLIPFLSCPAVNASPLLPLLSICLSLPTKGFSLLLQLTTFSWSLSLKPQESLTTFFFSSFLPVDNLHFILLHRFSFIHLLHVLRNYFSLADLTLTSFALFH